jgi:hypothetical protein
MTIRAAVPKWFLASNLTTGKVHYCSSYKLYDLWRLAVTLKFCSMASAKKISMLARIVAIVETKKLAQMIVSCCGTCRVTFA